MYNKETAAELEKKACKASGINLTLVKLGNNSIRNNTISVFIFHKVVTFNTAYEGIYSGTEILQTAAKL